MLLPVMAAILDLKQNCYFIKCSGKNMLNMPIIMIKYSWGTSGISFLINLHKFLFWWPFSIARFYIFFIRSSFSNVKMMHNFMFRRQTLIINFNLRMTKIAKKRRAVLATIFCILESSQQK